MRRAGSTAGRRWDVRAAAAAFGVAAALVQGPAAAHDHAAHEKARTAAAVTDPRVDGAVTSKERLALLAAAEAALANGDAVAAVDAFDRAAMMLHAADTEMGLVRAYLQQGEYRRALAFCAHTAGAHRDAPAASGLYAWLLAAGGQTAFAQRVLQEARSRAPEDPLLAQLHERLAAEAPTSTPMLRQTPHRLAPHARMLAGQAPPPDTARTASSGVLLEDGRHVLVPLAALAQATGLWVRDGLGRTTRAELRSRMEAVGLALLQLQAPLDAGEVARAARDPFAGSPGFVVAYAIASDAAPAWPWLHPGFVGGSDGAAGRRLGIAVPAGATGGALFDGAGRWSGIVTRSADGQAAFVPVAQLRDALGGEFAAAAVPTATAPTAPKAPALATPDVIYERALRKVVQLLLVS